MIAGLAGLTDRQSSLLCNENRQQIVRQLGRTPGLNINLLAEKTEISGSVVTFHLHRLADADLVSIKPGVKGNERLCFLKRDEDLWEDPQTRILFGREPARNVALYVLENPGVTPEEISEALERSTRSARHHLRTLEDRGLIDRVRIGRTHRFLPRSPLREWRNEVGDGFGRTER